MRVLFVCTANICRSPMAAALFTKAAHTHGASAVAASAGFLEGGRPVHEHVTAVLTPRGIDMSRKRSQKLSDDVVDHADLILTMTSEHARGVVSRFPDSISNVYTVRDFGTVVTPRSSNESTADWLAMINETHRRSYLGDDEALDIADPIGHDLNVFVDLATDLENTIAWIVTNAFPTAVDASPLLTEC